EVSGTIDPDPIKQYIYFPFYIDAIASVLYDPDTDGTNIVRYDYLHDANFNVVAIVTGTTSYDVVERYHYSPYGEVTILNGASDLNDMGGDWSLDADQVSDIGNEFLYTGRRLDPETGLQYSRYRFLHLQMGRWVNRDPIGYVG